MKTKMIIYANVKGSCGSCENTINNLKKTGAKFEIRRISANTSDEQLLANYDEMKELHHSTQSPTLLVEMGKKRILYIGSIKIMQYIEYKFNK